MAYRKKLLRFKKNEKIRLIAAVKVRRLLWDMMDSEHSDLMGVREAWKSVGAEIGRERKLADINWIKSHCNEKFNSFVM